MKQNHPLVLVLLAIILLGGASCHSMRKANYIERKFLLAKVQDTNLIKNKMPYEVVLTTYSSTSYNSTGGGKTSRWNSIDIVISDTTTQTYFLIDSRKPVFHFLEREGKSSPYLQEFQRKKRSQRIHRYSSLGAIAGGIFLLGQMGEDANYTKRETQLGNAGAYLLTLGFFNWVGGGLTRAIIRRATPMEAMYAYYFGPLPKIIPRVTRSEKRKIMEMFRSR
jgi:hypothetical protein